MNALIQAHLNRLLLVTVMFSLSASLIIDHKTIIHTTINSSSFPGKNDRLLRPIIVPNLTVPWNNLPSPRGENSLDKMTKLEHKNSMERLGKVPSEDSLVTLKGGIKPSENSVQKFSSRYSSKSEEKNDKSKVEKGKEKIERNKIYSDKAHGFGFLENEYGNRETPQNINDPLFISHSTSKKIEVAKPFNEIVNEAKEEEKVVPSIAISKPQKTTSFSNDSQKNFFSNKEYEDDEDYLDDDNDDEGELEEAEDDVEKSFFRDLDEKYKEYNSIQTPLKEIKYKGHGFGSLYNDFDSDFEYHFDWKQPRTRLLKLMERHPSSFQWPFTTEKQTENKISKDENLMKNTQTENESSKHENFTKNAKTENEGFKDKNLTKNTKIETKSSKDENLSKNVRNSSINSDNIENDLLSKINEKVKEIKRLNGNEKNNTHHFRSRGSKKFYTEPDTNKAKTVNRFTSNPVTQRGDLLNSPKKLFSPEERRNELLKKRKANVTRPVTYSSTRERKDDSAPKKFHSRFSDQSKKKTLPRQKEWQQDKQDNRKSVQENLVKPGDPGKSFEHLEETDEIYNQILSNIQSVFGIRTEPLKSSAANKTNSFESPKTKSEESGVSRGSLPYDKVYQKKRRTDEK